MDYKSINSSDYSFSHPSFDHFFKLFVSKYQNSSSKTCKIISSKLKLLSIQKKNDLLSIDVEFLPESNSFYNFILDLDILAKNTIIQNGDSWFGTSLNNITIENLFKKNIQNPKNIPALPFFTLYFFNEDLIKIKNKKKSLNYKDLKENMEIEVQFYINGIHLDKHKCNVVLILEEIKIISETCQSFECLFNNLEYSEDV